MTWPAVIFANNRTANEMGRASWLINSIGIISGKQPTRRTRRNENAEEFCPVQQNPSTKTQTINPDRKHGGHNNLAGDGIGPGNQAQQVGEENEEKQAWRSAGKTSSRLAHGVQNDPANELDDEFGHILQLARNQLS
jgi:hypothetical protein